MHTGPKNSYEYSTVLTYPIKELSNYKIKTQACNRYKHQIVVFERTRLREKSEQVVRLNVDTEITRRSIKNKSFFPLNSNKLS